MIKIGITGSSGFIGQHLVRTLDLKKNIKIFTIDKNKI